MSSVVEDLRKTLDDRYTVGVELLRHMKSALEVYQSRTKSKRPEVNIPRCSMEHLAYIVKDLTDYTEEIHKVRCALPRLLENGSGIDD